MKGIAASLTNKKNLLPHLLDLQGVQFFNLKKKPVKLNSPRGSLFCLNDKTR